MKSVFLPFSIDRARFNGILYRVCRFVERPRMSYEQSVAWVEEQKRLPAAKPKKVIGMEERLKEMEE